MANIREAIRTTTDLLDRHPNLEGSNLLKKESTSLKLALEKYNIKAEEIALSWKPGYPETAALLEGTAKKRVNKDFIRNFTKKYCSSPLIVAEANKKGRSALLVMAAREDKLQTLREMLDEGRKYREMLHQIKEKTEKEIRNTITTMPADEFKELVDANGLDATRTGTGRVSTSQESRKKAIKHILRDKIADDLMTGLATDA